MLYASYADIGWVGICGKSFKVDGSDLYTQAK